MRESSSRRVWQLAWPTILSYLLMTTVGFMHIKIVAQLGTSAVAAVTTGHRVFFLMQAILMGLSVAATALIARSWGADQLKQAEMVAWMQLAQPGSHQNHQPAQQIHRQTIAVAAQNLFAVHEDEQEHLAQA